MLDKVIEILAEFTEMKAEDMTSDTTLVGDMGLNSLDVVNIVVEFEDEFDIEIPDRIIKDFQTVGSIMNYLESHV